VSRLLAATLTLIVSSAATASGGGEGETSNELVTHFWQGLNLILLFGVLVYLGRRPIQDFFAERRNEVKSELDSAASVLSDAEGRLAEWQARADRLDAEVAEIKEMARQRANTESEHIVADAEASAERIRNDAHSAIDREVARARDALRAEAGELATKLASDLLRSNVNDADQQKLVDEFVARIESSGAASGRAN